MFPTEIALVRGYDPSGRYLTHFKKIVRDRSVFEDNQVDPAALQVCLASMAEAEDAEDEEVKVHVLINTLIGNGFNETTVPRKPVLVFYLLALPHTGYRVLQLLEQSFCLTRVFDTLYSALMSLLCEASCCAHFRR